MADRDSRESFTVNVHDWLNINTLHNVCAVHRGVCSTMGDVQYTGGISWAQWGNHEYTGVFSTLADIMSTKGDIMINVGKVIGKPVEFVWKPQCTEHPLVYSWYPPHSSWYPPGYSWYPPVYWTPPLYSWYPPYSSWYPPAVLMVSPHSIHGIPTVLNTPWCTDDIPKCTEHPPVYSMICPGVLNIPWCTAQTLCRVIKHVITLEEISKFLA